MSADRLEGHVCKGVGSYDLAFESIAHAVKQLVCHDV